MEELRIISQEKGIEIENILPMELNFAHSYPKIMCQILQSLYIRATYYGPHLGCAPWHLKNQFQGTGHHDIVEILVKVALNTKNKKGKENKDEVHISRLWKDLW